MPEIERKAYFCLSAMIKISRSFIKGSLIYTIAGALPMASALLLMPFYMASLSTADFGVLSIFLVFSLLVQLLVTYSYDTSLYIHYHEFKSDQNKLSSFISSAFVLMLLIAVGIALISLLTGDFVFNWAFSEKGISFFPYGWVALCGGVFQALVKVHSNLLQSREKPETFLWSNLMITLGIVVFTVAGLQLFPGTLWGPLGGRAMALFFGAIWVLVRIAKEFGFHFNFQLLKGNFNFNFYAFAYQLQQWVINYFDRPLMFLFLSSAMVGEYDFAIKCLIGIEFLINGLQNSFFPKVVKEVMTQTVKGSTATINRYYHGLIAVTMLLVCAAILIVPVIIEWLSDLFNKAEYKESIELIPYIAVLYLFRSVRLFFGYPYSILKYTKPLPVIYFMAALVKVGCLLLFIQQFDIKGVIMASVLSQLIEMIMLHQFIKKHFVFEFNSFKVIWAPLLLLLIIIVFESVLPVNWLDITHLMYCVVCLILLGWVYKNELKQINVFQLIK